MGVIVFKSVKFYAAALFPGGTINRSPCGDSKIKITCSSMDGVWIVSHTPFDRNNFECPMCANVATETNLTESKTLHRCPNFHVWEV